MDGGVGREVRSWRVGRSVLEIPRVRMGEGT